MGTAAAVVAPIASYVECYGCALRATVVTLTTPRAANAAALVSAAATTTAMPY